MAHLTRARHWLHRDQRMVVVMDATFTAAHTDAGPTPDDMAQVGGTYVALAASVPEVEILLVDAWTSGEDSSALNAWDLPGEVAASHEVIGRAITGRD